MTIAAAAAVASAEAQVVTGRVVDEVSGAPLMDAQVALHVAGGRRVAGTVTDSAGEFRLQAPRFGSFALVASMLGMETVHTDPFEVESGTLTVVLRMSTSAVPLEPLTVEVRSGYANLGFLAGYYERMAWNRRVGVGRFITRDAIDARNPLDMSDMLRELPRVTVNRARGTGAFVTMRAGRGECTPALYVDGVRTNRRERAYVDEIVRPMDVEGVEVYVGLAQLPGSYHDENMCGVVLVWTRRSSEDGRPFSWRRALVAGGIIGVIMLLLR
ncbi:MAG TPA: carboxypeptidase regulatory-like domain-containing protein [Longimicrobiales bacterium]|nr:carboxypeptidase regulatory-like domain-containing protein [Longimicrobiales bacterium]